eukprot:SAG31_NODE_1564_length_7868_cov_5.665766_9_plen_158_part_00
MFLTGDNGPPEDQCDWGGSKGPFLGLAAKTTAGGGGSSGKLTSWEGGHREVGVVVWPGKIKAGTVSHALSTTMDYLPTITALAGAPLLKDRTYDGKDLSPVLFEGATTHHAHLFFSVGGESYGVLRMLMLAHPSACHNMPFARHQALRCTTLCNLWF